MDDNCDVLLKISNGLQYVGLTSGMFVREAVEIPCPDSAAGLYIRTRTGQIVKVYFLVHDIPVIYLIVVKMSPPSNLSDQDHV